MVIKFFVSVSVQSSIRTRRFIFRALFELCLFFLEEKAKRCPLRPGKTRFPDVPGQRGGIREIS